MMKRLLAVAAVLAQMIAVESFFASSSRATLLSRSSSSSKIMVRLSSPSGTPDFTMTRIKEMVTENKVLLFMKGNRNFPQCGFSNTAVQILNACSVEFEAFDVFADEKIRQGIKEYSNWPTIPQLYIGGEFIGGCDIMIDMYKSGELAEALKKSGTEEA